MFDKKPEYYLRNERTSQYIQALSKSRNINITDEAFRKSDTGKSLNVVVKTIRGGKVMCSNHTILW